MYKLVKKRDGRIVPWSQDRITGAVLKAMSASSEGSEKDAKKVSDVTLKELKKKYSYDQTLHIEQIQDAVETSLILTNYAQTAKAYILYRRERTGIREQKREIPAHVKALVTKSKQYFRNDLGEFVYYRTYAKWVPEESRRETWIETVDRYLSFMRENLGDKLTNEEYAEVREAILPQGVMPSMRLMQFAGKAARKTNVCAYNCSFIAPESFQDFGEIMYICMCGTGVGFSVESRHVHKLPQIQFQKVGREPKKYMVPDSKEGWADALVLGMKTWAAGDDVLFDYSELRPAGARLETMGGKSSGPEPLKALLVFTREKMLSRQGRRLTTLDVHDIICKIGEIVVSGGVRRSALISLSDLDDPEMRDAKKGQFYLNEPQRSLANNSAVYEDKPSNVQFFDEWISLMKSGSGERGVFNRGNLKTTLPERRLKVLNDDVSNLGTNPCGEIILQSKQFCNLTEIIAREEDTETTLLKKIRVATILGTYQATLTDFGYLSKSWRENCERERLLGVSITGQWDSPAVRNAEVLKKMREESLRVNREFAKRFHINESTCVTCVKPSGTVSKTFDTAAGMHPRHAQHYIQRIRISATDSLFKMMKDQKVPFHPEVGQSADSATTYVLEFPVKAPEGSTFRDDITALEQLEYWKMVKVNFTEHNPSVTISVGEDEWIAVANWVYENWSIIGGLSFLPRTKHIYSLAPFETITKEQYFELKADFPVIDFSQILLYEKDDETEVKKELACAGGTCEIDDFVPSNSMKQKEE
jgi:ribonucleoside-triphosphate reductase (thioredoxin)